MSSHQRLYRRHDVYRRLEDGGVIVYRCLELIPGGGFVVQSADRVVASPDERELASHERRFQELLSEVAPEQRAEPQPSIEEAIRAFDASFD